MSVAARCALPPHDPLHLPPHQAILGLEALVHGMNNEVITLKLSRNKKHFDKLWETSWERFILCILFTYIIVFIYLKILDVDHAETNAVVPAIGYAISVCKFDLVKNWWLKGRVVVDERRQD